MCNHNVVTKIDEVEIIPCKPQSGLLAFASFVLNNSLYLGNIAIYSRLDGSLRLVYPQKTLPNGKTIRTFYPITRAMGDLLTSAVETKYNAVINLTSSIKKGGTNGSNS